MSLRPLAVDLDETLIPWDTSWENLRVIFFKTPKQIPALLKQILQGRAGLKYWLHKEAGMRASAIPLRVELEKIIRHEKTKGRAIHLISGAPQPLVNDLARRLGLDIKGGHWGSSASFNLTTMKEVFILKKFGLKGYDYFGDCATDLPIFKGAKGGAIVGARPDLIKKALRVNPRLKILYPMPSLASSLLKALRPHQWVKNLLLVVPLLSAHFFNQPIKWIYAFEGFLSFSFLSSAVYLLNDLNDLEEDRGHPQKKTRALASGELKIFEAGIAAGFLLGVSLALAWILGQAFFLCSVSYLAMAISYNIWAKRKPGMDLIGLAAFYTLRILAGGAAVGIACSPWLLAYSTFIFLSLACVKRTSELIRLQEETQYWAAGRGYGVHDLGAMTSIGISSGVVSVLVAALYVTSQDVSILYHRPQALFFLCPLLFYWVIRVWFKALRGQMPEDPVLFALKDRASWLLLILVVLTGVVASG
jgi:4-hydroxybenzoate polyprenyltransferase/phosphoserine phosphatase